MSYDLIGTEKFLCARERILQILRIQIGDQRMGKGFEGIVRLTFPSCTDELCNDTTYSVTVDSTTVFSRNNAWSGSSLSDVADKMNKDIDLYEALINRQPDNPDNQRD